MLKRKRKISLPHENVYARLGRSKIHGIGVVAIRDIPKGINLFANDKNPMVEFGQNILEGLNAELKKLYEDFCIFDNKKKKVYCPENFNVLTIGWYLNHSKKPNVRFKNDNFYTTRDIKKGEELTADYTTFSDLSPHHRSFTIKK